MGLIFNNCGRVKINYIYGKKYYYVKFYLYVMNMICSCFIFFLKYVFDIIFIYVYVLN